MNLRGAIIVVLYICLYVSNDLTRCCNYQCVKTLVDRTAWWIKRKLSCKKQPTYNNEWRKNTPVSIFLHNSLGLYNVFINWQSIFIKMLLTTTSNNGRGFLRWWEDASATHGQIDTLYSVILSTSIPCLWVPFIDFILFLNTFSWYHPQATRHIAESLLQNAQDGAFLLRDSSHEGDLALSVRYVDMTFWHMKPQFVTQFISKITFS